MQPKRRVFLLGSWAALLLAGLLVSAGCRRNIPPPPPPPFKDSVVRVACPDGFAIPAEVMRKQARVWAARQQARVEVVRSDPSSGLEKGEAADVWVFRPAELGRHALAGRLTSVPESLRSSPAYEWRDLLPFYREQLLLWDNNPQAVPLVGEGLVLLYRADEFGKESTRKAYRAWREKEKLAPRELRPPATWEEMAELAAFFAAHHPSGKPGPSLPPLPSDDEELDRLFYTVAAPHARRAIREDEVAGAEHVDEVFAFHFDLKTGKPRLDTPGFVYSLNLLKRLQACRPARRSAHPEEAFLDGQAVLGLGDPSWLVALQKGPLRDKLGIVAVPGADRYFSYREGREVRLKEESNRVPYLGGAGWLAAVPAGAREPEAAWDLLASLTGPELSGQTAAEPRWGGGPTRQEQVYRERWDSFDLDPERAAALKEALSRTLLQHGLKNPVYCLRIPEQAQYRLALLGGLSAALEKGENAAKELQGVSARWDKLAKGKGPSALEEYRISLGLLGQQ